jgi:hypothetical protein
MADEIKLPPGYTLDAAEPTPPPGYTLDPPAGQQSFGQQFVQEAIVNPAKQVGAGLVGASATANRMTANIADMADSLADHISKATGLPKGGLFHSIGEWARGNQHAQEQQAQQLSGGRQDLPSQIYRGAAQGAAELPIYATAGKVAGPVPGLAAVGAIREADRGWPAALKAAAEGALTGKALEVMGPASRTIRLTGAAAMTYAQARLNGADHTTALANATTMGGMSAMHPGGATAGDIVQMNANRIPAIRGGMQSRLNPVEQGAVDMLDERGVHMDVGTRTGNRFVKAAQAITMNQPLGAAEAMTSKRTTEQGLRRVAGELANEVLPANMTPESAGASIPAELKSRIKGLADASEEGYENAWTGRGKAEHTYDLPVRMAEDGSIIKAPVNMPVDVRDLKYDLVPVWDEMQWMPAADRNSSAGYQAVKRLLEGDDFIPAWQAERGLSGLKTMARTENASGVRNTSQGIGASIVPKLQESIDAAVAHTGDEAIRGLQEGRALHAQKMELAGLVDQLRTEPVQTFNQLTWRNDTGVGFLRKIAEQAPGEMRKIGRGFVQDLFDQAMRGGGFSKDKTLLNHWEQLGPETKKILFEDPNLIRNLDHFFKGQQMIAENPNPSGTAVVGSLIPGGMLLVTNPASGGAWLLGGYAASKLLFSPRGVALLTKGMRPMPKAAAGSAATELLRIAGSSGVVPVPGGPSKLQDFLRKSGPQPAAPEAGSVATGTQAVPFAPRAAAPGGKINLGVTRDAETAGQVGGAEVGGAAEGLPDHEAPAAGAEIGPAEAATEIRIPGAPNRYKAYYQLRELDDIQPSHSGHTFQPNERYQLKNDRDYSQSENQGKVVNWSGPEFDPSYHITDNPDASNGPPVIDEAGNVYGGNGRSMILQRVYKGNAAGAEAYRQMLAKKAQQFGVDPAQLKSMKQPVLVRVIPDAEMAAGGSKQRAVTDFNKTGTAALRGSEKAIADSRRVSIETLDNIGSRLEAQGADATLASILDGKGGAEVLQKLIDDGVISPQESAAYVDQGVLTADGKIRISKLMLGRFFRDPKQLDVTPASIRNKLERLAAPLAKVEGRPEWSLGKPLQEAIDLLEEARAHGQKNLNDVVGQSGLFGAQKYSPKAVQLAKLLRDANPNELTNAVRQYAQDAATADQGAGLFGEPPTPQESFEAAFAELFKRSK